MAAMVAMAFENIDQHRIATPWTPDQNHKQICKFVYMYFLITSVVLSFDVYLRIYCDKNSCYLEFLLCGLPAETPQIKQNENFVHKVLEKPTTMYKRVLFIPQPATSDASRLFERSGIV